jgi:hypothetical protein
MGQFSKGIQNFLAQVGADENLSVSKVPKSDSCAGVGEVVFFRYKLGVGKGSRSFRIVLLTEPITRDAKTGNKLLTGFKVPEGGEYTPDSLETLYNNKELPEPEFRTYIMSNIFGSLYKVVKLDSEDNE